MKGIIAAGSEIAAKAGADILEKVEMLYQELLLLVLPRVQLSQAL